jgi:hypothetical protein
MKQMKKSKQKCFNFFIDFKKAYDTIPPFLVLQQLRKNNLYEQSIIDDLMKGNTTTFEWNDISTKQEVKLGRGIRQGSVLARLKFQKFVLFSHTQMTLLLLSNPRKKYNWKKKQLESMLSKAKSKAKTISNITLKPLSTSN